jgi:hypothetical protein
MAQTESSLYPLVRDFLEKQGFVVHAEAKNCDVVGVKDGDLVVVELKVALSLELLAQGLERMKVSETVYVAVPAPKAAAQVARFKSFFPILRKLELGLLSVDMGNDLVTVLVQPQPYQRRRQPKARRALLLEIAGRSGSDNIGGSSRIKIITAYRESATLIAVALRRFGPMKPRDLRTLGTGPKTLSILSTNVYGWFSRQDRGIYALAEKGRVELANWQTLAERKEALLPDALSK